MIRPASAAFHRARALFVLTALVGGSRDAIAQRRPASAAPSATPAALASPESDAIRNLRWRSIGPANQAGRIAVVVGMPGDRSTYFVGAAAGGIIKTTNGGTTFTHLFDEQENVSIGDIVVAPSDPNVIYVGTGEGNPRNSASVGNGVYKSLDGGRSWKHLGLAATEKIPRLRVDPRNADVMYVCALGRTWGPNEDRGLYKTTDGGKSWAKILYKDTLTGCSDVDIDPGNANIVYAGMYTHRRYPWYFTSGGGETALYKSVDGGATWARLTTGLPKGPMDRIGVAVARSNPDIVYALSETRDEGELWRSDDAGTTWRVVNRDPNINFRPFYYSDLRVDPRNPNRVFTLSGALSLSEDGGRTFTRIANDVHGDHQGMWIDPTDPDYILSASDGGWQVSYDGSKNFEIVNTVAFTQFYHINLDMQKPYGICGGLQDNGHWCGPSRTMTPQGIRKADWVTVSGGDGFHAVPDIAQPWLVYSASQGGNIMITDMRTGDARSIHPAPNRVGSAGDALELHTYRFNWNAPIVLAPNDPTTVYFGGNVIFRTTDYGQAWTVISPDLTTNDKEKQKSSGGPIVVDNTAAEFHSTLLTIAPSPRNPHVIWAGSDDGNVQVTRDGGKTWTNTSRALPGMAPNAWISTIDASPHDAGTAFVAASHWQTGDYAPYAFATTDYGATWRKITTGLPQGWVHVIRQDPRNPNLLYLGTEFGIFASWDKGARWASIRNGIPPAPVRDLLVHPRDNELVIATHGRGLYILDDLAPLQQLGSATASDIYFVQPKPATRYVTWTSDANLAQKTYAGENPPYGALLHIYAKKADTADVSIADASGQSIRRLRRAPLTPGMNRIVWDLRYDASPRPAPNADAEGQAGGGGRFGFAGGPLVAPGEYTAIVTVNGTEHRKTVVVDIDPRATISREDLVAQRDAALALRDLGARVSTMVDRAGDLIRQLTNLSETLKRADARGNATAIAEADGALKAVRALRDDKLTRPIPGLGYRQYPRLREEVQSLAGSVSRSIARPTNSQEARRRELVQETAQATSDLNAIISGRIARINQLLAGSAHVLVPGTPIM